MAEWLEATLKKKIEISERVADLMHPCVPKLRRGASKTEAAVAMLQNRVSEATVVDDAGHLLGVVYAEDLFEVDGDTIDSIVRPARAVIPAGVSTVDAVRILDKIGCDHAVVVEAERVVGLFTWNDAVERRAN